MSRSFITRSRLLSRLLLLAALLLSQQTARAAGYAYQQHTVSAGVLFLGSAATPASGASAAPDPAPYVFYVLSRRPDVKPPDMALVNPLAPAFVTQPIATRWAGAYTVGQPVTPDMAAYWEVALNDISSQQISQYDVLYLYINGAVTFTPANNEKLRRFVDNGGQLFVEYGRPSGTPDLFAGTQLSGTASGAILPLPFAGGPLLHPLLSQPYLLTPVEQQTLGPLTGGLPTATAGIAGSGSAINAGEFNNLFAPVLLHSASSEAVAAAQLGAGQVVASSLNIGLSVGQSFGTSGPAYFDVPMKTPLQTDFYRAPAQDLKFLTNLITASEAHPSENKTGHGDASGGGLASFSPAWQVVSSSTATAPPGAAIWGNYVFVTDSTGHLRAFDAYPSENLTGSASATGKESALSQYPLTSYDEIWNVPPTLVGVGASAPTVVTFGGTTLVVVELGNGSLAGFNAVTGTAISLPAAPAAASFGGNAPAPTYYDGRLYAAQANGTLDVYDLNEGSVAAVPLNPSAASGESATGSPSVGTIADGDTNVLAAVVPTSQNVYTVLLGARNEPLTVTNPNGTVTGYSISRQNRYHLPGVYADASVTHSPALTMFDFYGNLASGYTPSTATPPTPQDPLFLTNLSGGYYTNWDTDFVSSTNGGSQVNMSYISALSFGALTGGTQPTPAVLSAAATDRRGDFYYTENIGANSYLIGVQNSRLYTSVQLKFRFLMPTSAGIVDADGVDYDPASPYLFPAGFHFVGAPVVDEQGNVYAVAVSGTQASVLCFRGSQAVTATEIPQAGGSAIDMTAGVSLTQTDEITGTSNAALPSSQFTADVSTVTFSSFGRTYTIHQVAGDLTEPQPVVATPSPGGTATVTPATLAMHTNLAWYTAPFTIAAPPPNTNIVNMVTGLSHTGNGLYLTDGTNLYEMPTAPLVGANKLAAAAPSITPLVVPTTAGTTATLGPVGAAPAIGGGVMVVTGANGIAALTRQVTVIADSSRVLGVDANGSAVWAVDATTRTDPTGAATKVAFSHPAALSQFAPNDYLAADTGNNRCVRFDSGGNVLWELTRFSDPNGLLAAGQPDTLSQPTSVVTRPTPTFPDPDQTNNPGGTITYYLIADSGNDRVLEVADRVTAGGAILTNGYHVLTWASHTGDRYGRRYRYGSAAYFLDTTASPAAVEIAATVTNTRLGPLLAGGQLGPVSADAPGGSLVVFNRPAAVPPFNSGPAAPNDLQFVYAGFYAYVQAQSGGSYIPYTIRSPRFLQIYTPIPAPPAGSTQYGFLYADDNGAFDLSFDATRGAFVAGPDRLRFATPDYQKMSYLSAPVPAFGVVGVPPRGSLPFVPTCVQALATDRQVSGSSTSVTRRYLLTQSFSQGELGSITPAGNGSSTASGKLGGEVFEVDVASTLSGGAVTSGPVVTTPGGFGGSRTLSHPALTGPLTQPTSALRLP